MWICDKRHNVSSPTFKVGDKVLLLDRRVKPNSDQVLTKRPFQGPFFYCRCDSRTGRYWAGLQIDK